VHQDRQAKHTARVVRTSVLILSLVVTSCASIPPLPSTSILLADFDASRGAITAVTEITPHAGYNNQPAFSADGRTVYYVDDVNGATDIVRYDRTSGARTRVTQTPEAEFSPTPMPDGRSLSAVRVARPTASGEAYTESQQLWRYDITGRAIAPILGMRRIGYHCWMSDGMVAVFVVGDEEHNVPHALRVVELTSRQSVTVASSIGRTLRMSPQNRLTYVDKTDSTQWMLMSITQGEERGTSVLAMPRGSEDFVWLADGRVLMSSADGLLIAQQNGTAWSYTPVSGVLPLRGRIGRIAMSADGRTLAMVVTRETAK
jgi:Tol biopolymer transport system component